MPTDQSLRDYLKLTYLVGQNNLSGRQMMPLISRQTGLNMLNILVKIPHRFIDFLLTFVSSGQKRDNRTVELWFLGHNDITLVDRATICLSIDLIRRYIVLYFFPKKSLLLPIYYEIIGLVGSQDGAYFHWSVPTRGTF